jgi:SAM-dependent methyltransferase
VLIHLYIRDYIVFHFSMKASFLICGLAFQLVDGSFLGAFVIRQFVVGREIKIKQLLRAGFGAGEIPKKFATRKKMRASDAKKAEERLMESYGGDIARGTEERINTAMSALPPHLQRSALLYKQTEQWNARLAKISLLSQSTLSYQDVDGARRAKDELEMIYQQHGLGENDMQKLYQKLTWDASAEAKAVRSIILKMPKDIEARVDKACGIIAHAVKEAGVHGRCLDVGCGYGVLVPYLTGLNVLPSQIVGVDLSSDMIYHAQKLHKGVAFITSDFLENYEDVEGFDGIIFCSSLHDLPDLIGALKKAVRLLRPNGKVVIMHAQGASHVIGQNKANPVLVKRSLPDCAELTALGLTRTLEFAPADAGSAKEAKDGYLAVLATSLKC